MNYVALRWILVGFTVICLALVVYWTASRPSRGSSRLGMRGMKRQQALLRYPLWASLEPLVRWMGARVSGVLDSASYAKLDLQLTHAGDFLGMGADEYFACMLLSGAMGVAVGTGVSLWWSNPMAWLALPLATVLLGLLPYLVVDGARVERFKAIGRGLPYAVDLMALSMSAGLDFPGSVQQVVNKAKANEALREELAYLLQQLQLGRSRVQALRELVARVPLDSVREFVQALVQAEERGNAVAAALEVQAVTSRTRRTNQAEKAAADMRTKMAIPTMMLVAIGLMLIAIPTGMMMESLSEGLK